MKKILMGIPTGMLVALAAYPALAFDIGEKVAVNGFVSQGYINSSGNNFLSEQSRKGTFQYNEAGVTLNSQVNDKLKVGVQFLSRDLGPEGNHSVKLDWAFIDYRFRDEAGVRLGKVKLPMGLYNEERDSDFLRPMVLLPQSIYDEMKRDLLVAYQGAGLYGNVPLSRAGSIDYHGFYGTLNFDKDSMFQTAVEQSADGAIRLGVARTTPNPIAAYYQANAAARNGKTPQEATQAYLQDLHVTRLDLSNQYAAGGSVIWNTPVEGLRTGASFLTVKNDIKYNLNKSATNPADLNGSSTSYSGKLENKTTYVVSAEYAVGDFIFAGEYSEMTRNQVFDRYAAVKESTSQSYYGMVTYSILQNLSCSLLYDVYYSDKDDKDGKKFVASAPTQRKDFMTWRKDLGLGVRYDVDKNWTLKAEYHYIDGAGLFMGVVNNANQTQKYWDYVALKASVNF